MLLCQNLEQIAVTFDDDHAVADAGLILPATLAQKLGVRELIDEYVSLEGTPGHPNRGIKAMSFVYAALAGGDCIDDTNLLRTARTAAVLGHQVRAPSTLGTYLRSFTWGNARQLDRVLGEVLRRAWSAGAGPADGETVTIDIDSTICETYGLQKEGGTRFGYTKVRGYHPQLAVVAGTGDVAGMRLRSAPAHTARAADGFVVEAIGRVRRAGATGPILVRADSGYYSKQMVNACRKVDARFSITAHMNKGLRKAIDNIPDDSWTPIPYWLDNGADVAETSYRFASREVRLIVRRVKPTPGSQLSLLATYDHHAFITDRTGDTLELEADHRRHAEIENTIRDLKYGVGLNHMPSGRFAANAAWLALNVIAHNLARWTTRIALDTQPLTTTKTLRTRYLTIPGRLTRSARRQTLHLPTDWPWKHQFTTALANLRNIRLTT